MYHIVEFINEVCVCDLLPVGLVTARFHNPVDNVQAKSRIPESRLFVDKRLSGYSTYISLFADRSL
jgi:hypothetical protein